MYSRRNSCAHLSLQKDVSFTLGKSSRGRSLAPAEQDGGPSSAGERPQPPKITLKPCFPCANLLDDQVGWNGSSTSLNYSRGSGHWIVVLGRDGVMYIAKEKISRYFRFHNGLEPPDNRKLIK